MSFYLSTLAVYFFIDVLLAYSLNLQFGWGGVPNFALIMFQAAGAYAAAVVSLGPDTGVNSFQRYMFGASWPFPLPLVLATVVGGVLALAVGSFSLRRIRRDYQAAILLIVSLIATGLVTNVVGFVNGSNGLTGVPRPLAGVLSGLTYDGYQWVYAAWCAVLAAGVYLLVARLGRSAWGRALRAVRDHEDAAAAIGLNPAGQRMEAFVLGGMIAGLSGGLLVEFLAAWSPAAWGYAETFAVFTAVILGGVGNNWGVALGTLLVQVIFLQVPTFLPEVGYTGLIDALQWVLIGALWLACLAIRPRGLIPERRHRTQPLLAAASASPPALPAPAPPIATAPPVASTPPASVPPVAPLAAQPGSSGDEVNGPLPSQDEVNGPLPAYAGASPVRSSLDGPVLDVRGVSVRFGGVEAVRDVSLQVGAGEVVGLIGPNGAGKSSLLGALGGQFAVASGRVLLAGHDVTALPPHRRARTGIVRTFQHTSTFDGLTVFENLLVAAMSARGARLRDSFAGGQRRRAQAAELVGERLAEFDMTTVADFYGSELSGGQRRLVEIMRCLMQSPRVLLLDEPMVGVAPHLVRRISEDCARISASGVAIVIVEHALEVVEAVCDRVIVMASGQVVTEASYAEAMSSGAVREAYFA
jgi:ABC-type branched-subunit amino acid transport system ATPase component/ABC-type branched-subunit amino acid transport system permease subunit